MGYGDGFRRAIVLVDGDAFFASCEQAVNPALKGKPVVTGKERGIVAAASYEAKALGVKRAVSLREARQLCPDLIVLPSNYETYSLFSKRMFEIMRRFSSEVEEYSIDEGFADLTGLRRPLNMSYEKITLTMKEQIQTELGITVSAGLAPNKVLAKSAAEADKPDGYTVLRPQGVLKHLAKRRLRDIWGIGVQTESYLNSLGLTYADQLARKSAEWVMEHLTKPHQELWRELNGEYVFPVNRKQKRTYASIGKTRTFSPPSTDTNVVYSQLSKNVENAFIKVRRHSLAAKRIFVFLKRQDFRVEGVEARLNRPTAFPNEVMSIVRKLYDQLYRSNVEYRATGVVLTHLQADEAIQMNLFEDPLRLEAQKKIFTSVDDLAKKYGKHTVFLGGSLRAQTVSQHANYRGQLPEAKKMRESQLHKRKFVDLPMLLGEVK